jgi:hypothetical protein
MARSSFVSFHYHRDYWRVQQILNMGALDGQTELPSQDWEKVKAKGRAAVEDWIDEQMKYKQAVIVLIGQETAARPFVKYEIERAWAIKKPLLGIRIHGLKDKAQTTDAAGANPFSQFSLGNGFTYASYVPVYDPKDHTGKSAPDSKDIHAAINANIAQWAGSGYKRP